MGGADVRLTFDNAIAYNGDGSDVCKVARDMKLTFEKLHGQMIANIDAEEEQRKSSGDVCVLCGCEKLLFEPTVYYCNGPVTGSEFGEILTITLVDEINIIGANNVSMN